MWPNQETLDLNIESFQFTDALRLILSGSYKIAFKPPVTVSGKQERFTLRIKTSQENAVILAAKLEEESSDLLKLEIKSSRFIVTSGINALSWT